MKIFQYFTLKILVFTLLIGGVIYLFENHLKPEWVHEDIWKILSFFFLLTWFSGMFVQYLMNLSKENSPNIIIGATGIRFLASAGFVALLLILGVENKILFVINFFLVYFSYLLFDIYGLMANLRPNSK
jgi:hypothetical protein